MLVVVPSHKRLPLLRWSVLSVLRAGREVAGEKRLLVVGNHPPSNDETRRLLEEWCREEPAAAGWDTEFIGRPVSMDPVDSWYGAITDHAREGEVVFLHGDDDLVMPGGFSTRADALARSEAPILISRHLGKLIYRGSDRCHLPDWSGVGPAPVARPMKAGDELLGNAPFIGNHAYRFNDAFRRTLDATFAECERQDWLPRRERTLMLPYYLPFMAIAGGHEVLGLDHPCEIRGNDLDEIVRSPFRNANWSNGFLYGITLDLLHHGTLAGLEGMAAERELYGRLTAECYLAVIADRRLDPAVKAIWREKVKPLVAGRTTSIARGALPVAGELSGLTRLRLRLSFSLRPTHDLRSELLDVMHPPVPRETPPSHG
jgi:hypothetical protein